MKLLCMVYDPTVFVSVQGSVLIKVKLLVLKHRVPNAAKRLKNIIIKKLKIKIISVGFLVTLPIKILINSTEIKDLNLRNG